MKSTLILCMTLLFAGVLKGAEKNITLSDANGKTYTPLVPGTRKAVVLFFISPFCPTSNTFLPEINRIASDYADRFAFYSIEAEADIRPADVKKHIETFEIKMPVLLDPKQELVHLTKAKTTPEAVVIGANGDILYKGRINDLYVTQTKKLKEPANHDLRITLDVIAAGKPVPNPETRAIGCSITVAP